MLSNTNTLWLNLCLKEDYAHENDSGTLITVFMILDFFV